MQQPFRCAIANFARAPSPSAMASAALAIFASDSTMRDLRKFRFFGWPKIERSRDGKLFFPAVPVARPQKRFAPLQMEAPPIGRVFVCLLELDERQIGSVFSDQHLAPHLQWIGEMRSFLVRALKLRDGVIQLATCKQCCAPIRICEWNRGLLRRSPGEPPIGAGVLPLDLRYLGPQREASITVRRSLGDQL